METKLEKLKNNQQIRDLLFIADEQYETGGISKDEYRKLLLMYLEKLNELKNNAAEDYINSLF